ncbi:MAG TPA: hypothetical protein VK190_04965 [Pseudoneobacillus sp.]|nr:hypothetical protein [Pseudoneobacillus sp.]
MSVSFITGSMFGAKSKILIECIESVESSGEQFLVIKPVKDTRDGLLVKSRDSDKTVEADAWDENNKLMRVQFLNALTEMILNADGEGTSVFIDEGHFLSLEDMQFIVNNCKEFDVNLYVSGLETSFKIEWFPSTKWLKGVCDTYIFLHGRCSKCGKDNAVYNILYENGKRVIDGESIHPGDTEYNVLCENCL